MSIPELTPYLRGKLQDRADRFAKLIRLNAPALILLGEINLILTVADAAFGAGAVTDASDRYPIARAKMGLCHQCNEPVANDDPHSPLCAAHLAEQDQIFAEWDEEASGKL